MQLCSRLQEAIPYFRSGLKGVARSMPTSAALDRCAACRQTRIAAQHCSVAAGPGVKGTSAQLPATSLCTVMQRNREMQPLHRSCIIWKACPCYVLAAGC